MPKRTPPVNYDFVKNWKAILPHLYGDEVDKIITQVLVCQHINGIAWNEQTYTGNECPSSALSKGDSFATLVMELSQDAMDDLDSRYLTSVEQRFLKRFRFSDSENEELVSEQKKKDRQSDENKYNEIMSKVGERMGYAYSKTNRDKIVFWIPFGACHSWNAIWGLWLAKKVLPNGDWIIRTNHTKHTTIYSKKLHMVFDILAYFWGTSLVDMERGEPLVHKDNTLGGAEAWNNSDPKNP